ncbi:MAG TPA: alpha/beta hydrolase [Candidatus Saccharimonadia bacterium]|nr:alpha/beta hydrolase [Candidatus Saccharimonadia bacterium]
MEIQLPCTDYSIAADWHENSSVDKVLLILYGYMSAKNRKNDLISIILKQTNLSVLVIDYSGHGASPFKLGDTSPAQHLLEVVCAIDWIKQHYPRAKLYVDGMSYGGFLGAWATKYRTFDKLVLRAPAIFRPETFYTSWSVLRTTDETRYKKDMEKYRRNTELLQVHPLFTQDPEFKGQTLVIVHEYDEGIPRQTTDLFIKAFNAQSHIALGFAHNVRQSKVIDQQRQVYYLKIATWLAGPVT